MWRPLMLIVLVAVPLVALLVAVMASVLINGDVPTAEALRQSERGVMLVDVRSHWERDRSAVPGSLHAPWRNVVTHLRRADVGLDQPLIVYCMAGPRARWAATRLQQAGFTEVRELRGGHADLARRSLGSRSADGDAP
ncbi:MAG: rhodanese-like domain-containing protein [Polycyclovorans sp.]|jgi:rhodanese-related sulfurtransferase